MGLRICIIILMMGKTQLNSKNFDCPFQKFGKGKLTCTAADNSGRYMTDEVNQSICQYCEAGRIFRDVGCNSFNPKILLSDTHQGIIPVRPFKILCVKRKQPTTLSECQKCDLVTAETTKDIFTQTIGLFRANNFESALNDLEKAKASLHDNDYADAITGSISSVESVMKSCLENLNQELPSHKDITGLWKILKKQLAFDKIDPSGSTETLLGNLSGAISHLGGIRNNLGDAHGKGLVVRDVPYSLAELSINASATLSTIIIRRYLQMKNE